MKISKATAQQASDAADGSREFVCRDCGRGVDAVGSTRTGYRHRAHREGEPDWRCPRTPLPPVGVPSNSTPDDHTSAAIAGGLAAAASALIVVANS